MNTDIISEISEFLETKDTVNMSKVNKKIYGDRDRYSIYEIPYEKIEENKERGYKIKGIKCKYLDEKILKMLNSDKRITHLLCEEECNYDIFIELKYVINVRLKKGLGNIKDFNKMYSIKLPEQIENYSTEYQYHNYDVFTDKSNLREVIDMENCNNLKHVSIYLNQTNIILPNKWKNTKHNYINIVIDKAKEYDDINNFKNKHIVNKIKYIVKNYVSDNKFEKLELNLMDYLNVKILEIELCEDVSGIYNEFFYMEQNTINEFLIDVKHNEGIEIINIKTWDKLFSYNVNNEDLTEKINKINDNQTNIVKIISTERKIFYLNNKDYLYYNKDEW